MLHNIKASVLRERMFFCVFGGGGSGSAAPAISGATSDDLVETMVRVWARGRRGELARECEGGGARGAVRGAESARAGAICALCERGTVE